MTLRSHLISSCPFGGGAARAAFRLHEALRADGVDSLWVDGGGGAPERSDVFSLSPPNRRRRGIWMRLTGRGDIRRRLRPFVGAPTYASWPEGWGGRRLLTCGGAAPAVYNLHWVAGMLDWRRDLPALAERAPVVWTLHDLNPTRGVWHYDPSERETNPERNRLDAEALRTKRNALAAVRSDRLVFVAPSRWMAERCRSSELTRGFTVEHIANGIDLAAYCPVERAAAKLALGLESGDRVLGFVADGLADPRKGMPVLGAALHRIGPRHRPVLLTVGRGQPPAPEGVKVVALGPVAGDRLLRMFYSACDLFVCPSLQDNLPNTVMEAMACGTAVLGHRVGGIPDMVISGQTGWLAEPDDGQSLAEALDGLLANSMRLVDMGKAGRARAEAEFGAPLQAARYRALFEACARS